MIPTAGESFFIDTNILLIATDESRAFHGGALKLISILGKSGFHQVINGQVIREYLTVATRPVDVNGLGISPGDAIHNIKEFTKRMFICDEKSATSELLQHYVLKYQLKGKRIHDANITAIMKTHGIKALISENADDFRCFDDIHVFSIKELLVKLNYPSLP